jgi:hypothetical protein
MGETHIKGESLFIFFKMMYDKYHDT